MEARELAVQLIIIVSCSGDLIAITVISRYFLHMLILFNCDKYKYKIYINKYYMCWATINTLISNTVRG